MQLIVLIRTAAGTAARLHLLRGLSLQLRGVAHTGMALAYSRMVAYSCRSGLIPLSSCFALTLRTGCCVVELTAAWWLTAAALHTLAHRVLGVPSLQLPICTHLHTGYSEFLAYSCRFAHRVLGVPGVLGRWV